MSVRVIPLIPGDSGVWLLFAASVLGAPLFGCAGLFGPWGWAAGCAVWLVLVGLVGLIAWGERARDARLGPDGLEVAGEGRWPLATLAGARIDEVDAGVALMLEGQLVASTLHPEEAASLRALAATARAAASDRTPALDPGPQVSRCPGCAAPLVPSGAERTACAACGRDVLLPAGVRAVAAAQQVAPAVAVAVGRLAAVPSAAGMRRALVGAFAVTAGGWPVVGGIGVLAARGAPLDGLDLATLSAVGVNLGFTLPLRVRALAADRRAWVELGCRFGAAPAGLDEPERCRSCAGPLPEPGSRARTPAALTCAWCGAPNVVGLGLVREAVDAAADADLVRVAAERETERASRRRGSWLSAALVALTPWMLADLVLRALG